ncbi:SUF system NifU family Fe-S cluster assembly protein [Candidatus Uhrbacteria bacterium]|nr:SUF system NifU family Fe-S cluster assembly protein [Candidatus Uhrbacteria bacterium]
MDLYSEIILDHYRNPHHARLLQKPSVRVKEHNPLCGDTIELDLLIQNDHIENAGFKGTGCAISQASASMLMDMLIGKKVGSVKKLFSKQVIAMLGVPLSPARAKCALLPLVAAKHAILKLNLQ